MNIKGYMRLMRPQQWVKNVFVLMPAFFAGTIVETAPLCDSLLAFAMFCMISSAVYCFNDMSDVESDRRHPVKRTRPIASGAVSMSGAAIFACFLTVASILGALWLLNAEVMWVIISYLALNILYTSILKKLPLVDISIVALGYVLRLLAGSFAADCTLSSWIVVIAFMLCLFLVLGKRREDGDALQSKKEGQRPVYSKPFIDIAMSITCAIVICAYLIYSIVPSSTRVINSPYFYTTGLPVIIGLLRYLQICMTTNSGGSHSAVLFKDFIIVGSIIVYLAIYICLYYF